MEPNKSQDDDRACRIAKRINEYHILLDNVYEQLVDREFLSVRKEVHFLIMELRFTLKSIEDDDF
jgi:hypothetical protein